MELAYIPSPSQGVWHLGPVPIRAYALCILAGIAAAIWLTRKRWIKLGGNPEDVFDVALWAVPFGIVGGRLYHVITDPELYFKAGEQPIRALYIWDGGLGIWGAVALGAVGAWIGCRRKGIPLSGFADALAPGLILAQAIGRWGNWFNQELYGNPTTLPWGLKIDKINADGTSVHGVFQPTFLYECLWDLAIVGLLLYADRRWKMHNGRLFALYVAGYTLGRFWVEALRSDHANRFLGLRLNDWTALLLFAASVIFLIATRNKPVPENPIGASRIAPPAVDPSQADPSQAEPSGAPEDADEDAAGDTAADAAEPETSTEPDGAEDDDNNTNGSAGAGPKQHA
ncbi:prolipoprotein diacylglyceryl transferase [Streptacidiphilus jiangxiensis]|uniref:Phosphatidylglycerol--prolipoprotein diacylglyceryl transferase n=1 Tax=Streptacidiphilus jiangxiensis TaxID=235985 RepID=A0A1H7Y8G8_STRJI|nr:prolipoprotein diacylglyceryl transferase [Streptacidiphilus jiangxiensis]SEM42201.1 prolipoprotein diacylglyceryl transferase [Streptacidiphilus jiangxiensis]